MPERESSRYIDATAADWIARLDRGPLSKEEEQAFEAWLRGDPRRRGALLRAGALSMLSESAGALGPQFDPARFAGPAARPRAVSRRRMLAWTGAGGAIAASIAMFAITVPAAGAITTGLGEVRLVTLDDGSTVMLNTETSMRIRYSDSIRRIELLYGEAYFTVVGDQRRPFLVDASGASLRTTRATFRVRKLEGKPVDILVDQGGIALQTPGGAGPVTMPAHSRLTLPPAAAKATPAPRAVPPDLVSRELAWREGKIAFEGERLDQAAAEFARYSRTRIEIRDAGLASEPVTGLFSASDPAGFSRAVARVFGARVEQRPDAVILTR